MIRLYRLDGTEFLLNVDLIGQVNSTAGTVITLLSGERIEVKNTEADVVAKMKAARQGRHEEDRQTDEAPESEERAGRFFKR
jgi:uncharacterized protein YlzI (FlbEa/FlbD family)